MIECKSTAVKLTQLLAEILYCSLILLISGDSRFANGALLHTKLLRGAEWRKKKKKKLDKNIEKLISMSPKMKSTF